MKKKDILSKINFKDYNNEVEEILEKKNFSSNVKNLLLSMFYKIEVAYKDYTIAKRDVTPKDGFIESIIHTIKEDCDIIEFVEPKEDQSDILAQKNLYFIVDTENKKIISYANEQSLFHAILRMSQKYFYIDKQYQIFEQSFKYVLNIGYELDKKEIITNFDGWSWNNRTDVTQNSICNLVYQNIRFLLGNNFLYEWKRDRRLENNYIEKIRNLSNEIYLQFCNLCLLINCKSSEEKKKLDTQLKELKTELKRLENKNELLQEIYEEKKKLNEKIKIIDKLLSDKELLKEELQSRNQRLADDLKIITISSLEDIIGFERKQLLNKLQEYNKMIDPKNYIKKVKDLKEKIDIIENLNLKEINEEKIFEYTLVLQKAFLNCIQYLIDKTQNKKDMIELIYKLRYYKFLPIVKQDDVAIIQDIEELQEQLNEIERAIITKACKMRVLTIINEDIEYNYKIINIIINTKIIDMENIIFSLESDANQLIVNIYDKEIIEEVKKIPIEKQDGYNIKFNKKNKLFI